ncbi:BglG family transcription antiterminator [Bacillus sp. JJ1764]|uniref:BglG family transcription antiterminator n=1 Tax=Bacillus sp. JJ1764 TaxID=3122964 RepID=UPI003000B4CD
MLNGRQTVIIRELMKADSPVTSDYLAKVLDVTSRTVRNDIKELEANVKEIGASIKSIRGTGYQLFIHDEQLFRHFLQDIVGHDQDHSGKIPTLPEERVHYIVKRLLLTEYIKLDDLAEELYISRSTLQNDFKEAKEIFKRYGIKVEKRPNFGLRLIGSEFKLRLCIADYAFADIESEFDMILKDNPVFAGVDLNGIKSIILTHIGNHQIVLSDIGLTNLIIHIAIAYNRIKSEKYVTLYNNELADLKTTEQYEVAKEIVHDLEIELHIRFPEQEIAYITIHLLGTKMITALHLNDQEVQSFIEEQIYDVAKVVLETIDQELHLNIKDDQELFLSICLHLKPAIHRTQYGINLPNPLLEEIKTNYPAAFQASVIAGMVLKKLLDIEINENEMGYLALHLGAAIENRKNMDQPKKCMIVCASGVGSARLLATKIEAKFGSRIEIVGTTEFYKINQIPLNNIDFLISTIPIPMQLPVPVIHVKTILGGGDFEKIEQYLGIEVNQKGNYIRKELVFLRQHLETREDVLHFVVKQLKKLGLVNDLFLKSVLEREELSPTSYGNFVAIPHPLTPQTDSTFWAICTLQKPIDWGGKRVQFICLLSVEKNSSGDLQKMYDLLINIIDNGQVVQQLLKCKTYQEFAPVFQKNNEMVN